LGLGKVFCPSGKVFSAFSSRSELDSEERSFFRPNAFRIASQDHYTTATKLCFVVVVIYSAILVHGDLQLAIDRSTEHGHALYFQQAESAESSPSQNIEE
jgi:hypothetical protein